jgi:hypothetical protein
MAYFQTKNPNLGQFWRALKWKMLVYFKAIWNILRPIGIFIWPFVIQWSFGVYFSRFGILYHEKSGNPASDPLKFTIYGGNVKAGPNSERGLPEFSWYNIPKRKKYTKKP